MIKKAIHTFMLRRHFWRHLDFSELSELYISMMFRSLASSLLGIFIPLYLIQLGYGLPQVIIYYVLFFIARVPGDVLGAYLVAKIGPKHVMLISYFVQVAGSMAFLTLPQYKWPLVLLSGLTGLAASLFFIAYHVDFSKIKHSSHGGKELSYMHIMEKAGVIIGPLLGGAVATIFGSQYAFLVAIVLLLIGAAPLFATGEPVRVNQHITLQKFPFRQLRRDFISYSFFALENVLSVQLWPVYLALFVLGTNSFAEMGVISAVSVLISMCSAHAIGKLIDNKKGESLLRLSATANAVVHLFRPFVSTVPIALGLGSANEVVTTGYRMPFYKGLYDASDQLPGYRIVYITAIEVTGQIVKAAGWGLLLLLSMYYDNRTTLNVGFGMAAVSSLLIMTENFAALKNPRLQHKLRRFGHAVYFGVLHPVRFPIILLLVFAITGLITAALLV